MGTTRRTQVLMNPLEYRRLQDLARRKNISVGELIRTAVRQTYLVPGSTEKKPIVEAILKMRLPAMGWKRAKKEIESGHARIS